MPRDNRFRHQSYPTRPAQTPTRHVLNVQAGEVDFGRLHRQHAVQQVILVPGTFAGDDPFNIAGTLNMIADRLAGGSLLIRELAERVAAMTHTTFNQLADDVGNYSAGFAERFEELTGGDPSVRVLSPAWSGQNHHFARADLAVRLLDELSGRELFSRDQILLWGHSHAGNGFALLSNLLANDRTTVGRFFQACGFPEHDRWRRAWNLLRSAPSPHPLAQHVTCVTFGTPVRYGWDLDGLYGLYHVLFDRGLRGADNFTTRPLYPPHTVMQMLEASFGDWVQAFAIEGTDVVPPVPDLQRRDEQISRILAVGLQQPEIPFDLRLIPAEYLRKLCARWKTGTRCHADGVNLLVDYEPSGRILLGAPVEHSIFGHGVATTVDWLPAHLTLLLEHMDRASAT